MSLPDQTPKLPKLPFLAGDAALLALAWYLVHQSPGPLSVNTIAAVTACAALGSVLGIVPFLTDYARKQDEALDERQRGLEALGRTINTAAEQISIAARGLDLLNDDLHKNLKHAEQLPHKLQEKIAEFNAQLDNVREDEREELEKELAELRASETERLESTADKIHKAAAELTKLDAAAQKQIAARMDLLQRASDTIAKAQADASIAITDASTAANRDLVAAQAKALAEFETRAAALVATIQAAFAQLPAPSAPPSSPSADTNPTPDSAPAEIASPPKRPRKARRDDIGPAEPIPPTASPLASQPAEPPPPEVTSVQPAPVEPPTVTHTDSSLTTPPEPAPVPPESTAQIAPVASSSADPLIPAAPPIEASPSSAPASPPAPPPPAEDVSIPPAQPAEPEPASTPPLLPDAPPAAERAPKKRSPKKPIAPSAPELPLTDAFAEEFTLTSEDGEPVTSREIVERVISSDGATRLIATAYIGIGNRLFIRGDGPGLSWDKGVPLQFISIGKWRWETPDASAPIQFKLYKNDEIECASLGALTLDPGHQQEVTAKF